MKLHSVFLFVAVIGMLLTACGGTPIPTASQKLGEQAVVTNWQHRLGVAEARLKRAQERVQAARPREPAR